MWKYSSANDYPNIILHDCRITKVSIDNKDIIFEFDDSGFWVTVDNNQNPFKKTLRTDRSEIRFVNVDLDFSSIYIFKAFHLFRKHVLTRRVEISLEDFASQINNGNNSRSGGGRYGTGMRFNIRSNYDIRVQKNDLHRAREVIHRKNV